MTIAALLAPPSGGVLVASPSPSLREQVLHQGDAMTQASKPAYTAWQDEEERERLLMLQLPQVRYIARRIHERLPRHVPLEDLVHAGVVGLIDALHKFNREKHVQFASYAKFRIRGAILDSLREMDWSPRDLRRQSRRVERPITICARFLAEVPPNPNWRSNWNSRCPSCRNCWAKSARSTLAAFASSRRKMARKKIF